MLIPIHMIYTVLALAPQTPHIIFAPSCSITQILSYNTSMINTAAAVLSTLAPHLLDDAA